MGGVAYGAVMAVSLYATPPGRRLDLTSHHRLGQLSFDDLGTSLDQVTFVVVDLETTGGRAGTDAITELGAVKVLGGAVTAEFHTLVNPGTAIPPFISALTGITTAMVAAAPRIESVLPSFLEWAQFSSGAVLVAHNARFDVGFLVAAAQAMSLSWPSPEVVDTLVLARRAISRDQVPNYKLATLVNALGVSSRPTHRALDDARATVEVLHRLLELLAPLGLTHREDLRTVADPVPIRRRRKVNLARNIPHGPGIYQFLGPAGEVLYVGTSSDLHTRVRAYFTAAEKRRHIAQMVDLAVEVRAVPCSTVLEARIREVRQIAQLQPPYNIRSRSGSRKHWLRLTSEPFPRVTVVQSMTVEHLDRAWGPFESRRAAQSVAAQLAVFLGLRTCSRRLPSTASPASRSCVAAELGQCLAPCTQLAAGYAQRVSRALHVLTNGSAVLQELVGDRLAKLTQAERFEEAAQLRDALHTATRAARRATLLRLWLSLPQVVAAAPGAAGWELAVIRYGALAAAGVIPPGGDASTAVADALARAAEIPRPQSLDHTLTEETELIVNWLEQPGVRLAQVDLTGPPLAFSLTDEAALSNRNRFARRSWNRPDQVPDTM